MIKTKRIYEAPKRGDGFRVLVDRLWPRGVSKEKADLDLWFKDAAPSTVLRKWFNHDPKKWKSFQSKYKKELHANAIALQTLKTLYRKHKNITLLYGARDVEHNEAAVLAEIIKK